ncbi:CHAT domain-containing protein [Streptomyces sp. NPDC057623]|uniref:CHAT domain-containing protein n=1 Tax=Streptomyces sp. NPDC057623 TaxID=3346187 RepID=UPI0036806EF3
MPDRIELSALLQRLESRLSAYRRDGDADAIRSPAAFDDADRLHCALAETEEETGEEPADSLAVWAALAEFHELRKESVPPGPLAHDPSRAAFYHCRLYRRRPELVPPQIRRKLDSHPNVLDVMGATPRTMMERVLMAAEASTLKEARQNLPEGFVLQLLHQVLGLVSPAHPLWPECLAATGFVAFCSFRNTGDNGQLTAAISASESALEAMPRGHHARAAVLSDLSLYLRRAARRADDTQLLARAGAAVQEALALTPVATRDYAKTQITYANLLVEQYRMESAADPARLDEAESATRAAVASGELSRQEQAQALSNLGDILDHQYERTGRVPLLQESADVSRRAVDLSVQDDAHYATCRANLGAALLSLARAQGDDPALLREAEEQLAGTVELLLEDEARAHALSALGSVRLLLGKHVSGAAAEDHDPVDLQLRALEALPEGHRDRAAKLLNLATSVVQRHLRLGDAASMPQHLELLRRMARVSGRERAIGMNALSQALIWHSKGNDNALDEAEGLLRDVAEGGWAGVRDTREATHLLGLLLHKRFETARDTQAHTLQSWATSAALRAIEDGYPLRDRAVPHPRPQHSDSRLLGMGDVEELDRALGLLRVGLTPGTETTERGDERRSGRLHHLAMAIHDRYLHDNDIAQLQEAIDVCREARDLSSEGSEQRAFTEMQLAFQLRDLYEATSYTGALAEAADLFRGAALTPAAPMRVLLRSAQGWAESASRLGYTDAASKAYDTALELLELASWSGIDREGQESLLRAFDGLARDAAALALDRHEYERAVEVLEYGRGVMLSRALGGRAAFHRAAGVSPELANRFAQAHARAEAAAVGDEYGGVLSTGERLAAAQQRKDLIQEIRKQDGLADFLSRPSYSVLRGATEEGAVIIVNASRSRCDALVVRPGQDPLPIPLDGVSYELVESYARRFSHGLDVLQGNAGDGAKRAIGRELVMACLEWLWLHVCEPILTELGHTRRTTADEAERVWWCPTGPFASLPLHAAGLHGRPGGRAQAVLDRVVSSYTPTLRQLVEVRSAPAAAAADDDAQQQRALVVAVPESHVPGGQQVLRTAWHEAQVFLKYFPSAKTLIGPDATEAAVLEHLSTASWVHFACHGTVHGEKGEEARLLLQEEELAMEAVSRLSPAAGAEFAFFSACSTARSVRGLNDESLNLATMAQLAGYRHVIGTLWSIDDSTAPTVAESVYARLVREGDAARGTEAARALHKAVLEQRDASPMAPVSWCAYVHLGP